MNSLKRISRFFIILLVAVAIFIDGALFMLAMANVYRWAECEIDLGGFQCAIIRGI